MHGEVLVQVQFAKQGGKTVKLPIRNVVARKDRDEFPYAPTGRRGGDRIGVGWHVY